MHEKEKDLISAFLRGQVDRRGLIKGLGALGRPLRPARCSI